jgi:hypothetical protein
VNADLEQLVALQTADTSIRRLQAEIDAIPQRRAEIDKEFDQRASEFKAIEERRDAARAMRLQLDNQLAEQRARAEKAERDLMSSTNSKSYEAAIREADAAKKQIGELETKVLEQMEQLEQAEQGNATRSSPPSRNRSGNGPQNWRGGASSANASSPGSRPPRAPSISVSAHASATAWPWPKRATPPARPASSHSARR